MKKLTIIAAAMVFVMMVMFGCTGSDFSSSNVAVVRSVTATPSVVVSGGTSTITCDATGKSLRWETTGGAISGSGLSVVWTAPTTTGIYSVTAIASDSENSDSKAVSITVTAPVVTAPKWTFSSAKIQSSDLNKATGEIYSVTAGSNPLFVKFNADGSVAWAKSVQIPGYTVALADRVRISPDGNTIYLSWRKPPTFPAYLRGLPSYGIAVSAFDVQSNYLWTYEIDPERGINYGLATDNTGVYAIGVVTFFRDNGIFKISTSGDLVWQKEYETGGGATAYDIKVFAGYVYTAGRTNSNFPGFSNAGHFFELFVTQYDVQTGNRIWVNQSEENDNSCGYGIVVNSNGVFVSGASGFLSPEKFLIRKYDFDGEQMWSKDDYLPADSTANKITADEIGLYVSGTKLMKIDFDGRIVWKGESDFGSDMFVFSNILFTTSSDDNYLSRHDVSTGK